MTHHQGHMRTLLLAIVLLVLPPVAGLLPRGGDLAPYLEFPPLTRYVQHPGFAWPVFTVLAVVVALTALLMASPALRRALSPVVPADSAVPAHSCGVRTFPAWGWAGLGLVLLSWAAAWTHPAFLGPLARHAFTPLWFGFILVLDGLVRLRKGESMLTRSPRGFALLFPVSAVAWWYFEYLNRFVQNWYYCGVADFSALEYVLLATPPFATVLPAVFEFAELLGTCRVLRDRYWGLTPLRPPHRAVPYALMTLGVAGLGCISLNPAVFYPLLWLAPLCIAGALLTLAGTGTPFSRARRGDWRAVVWLSLGALGCGFFWEMWNWQSMPKWQYSVPYVQRFHLFEMPLLGYAGYLPFGIECYCLFLLVRQAWPCEAWRRLNPAGVEGTTRADE